MPAIDLQKIADASKAELYGANAVVAGLCIDSRALQSGDVFVALRGERVDGHQFVEQVVGRGAAAAIVEQYLPAVDLPQLVVADSRRALAAAAALNCRAFDGTVVAITGSAGKTSCKNMTAAILARAGAVCASEGNFNNEIGLPLMAQKISSQHDFAVLEMGAAKPGDIRYLTEIARPDIAVITNVGEAHCAGFGGLQRTAQSKGEIYRALPKHGIAVINRDDNFAGGWREEMLSQLTNGRIIEFSLRDSGADIYASDIVQSIEGLEFIAHIRCGDARRQLPLTLPCLGAHTVANALAAIAVATALSVEDADIAAALAVFQPQRGRLCPLSGKNQLQLLDDSYNANPEAVVAAIDTLIATTDSSQRRVVVLGDMAELGDRAGELHRRSGAYAAAAGVDCLYAVGEFAAATVAGFEQRATAGATACRFDSKAALLSQLLSSDCRAACVLIKGSRSAAMDELVLSLSTAADVLSGAGQC